MTKPNFTEAQKSAISTTGCSLVVSAGAGSGKTTVLTQRIIKWILDGGDIDDVLVVTFTRAAAADMKEKLYNTLSEAAAQNVENKRLAEMCLKISSARISTISSFCYGFVRENFEQLGLSPRLRMADEGETKLILDDCLARVEEDKFEAESEDIILLADEFADNRSFNSLNEMLLYLYGKFRAFPFWKSVMTDAADKLRADLSDDSPKQFINDIISDVLCQLNGLKKRAESLLEYVNAVAVSDKNVAPIEKLCDSIEELCNTNYGSYSQLRERICSFDSGRLNLNGISYDERKYISDEKEAICKTINKSIRLYFEFSEEQIIDDARRVLRLNDALRAVLFALDDAYTDEKNRRGICDYADAEQLTLKLLAKKMPGGIVRTELCRRYGATVKQIYVDEYQDVNPLQDLIFSLLSDGRNSFFVGDVKQSIYRFRNASADIFGDRVKSAENSDDVKAIFLSENFRSTQKIIDFVNRVFETHYTTENTGYSYENERLKCGRTYDAQFPVEVTRITDTPAAKAGEREATIVAARILQLVGRANKNDNSLYSYGDFAVLLRSASGKISDYERVFRKYGIPFCTDNSVGFLELPEIMLAVSLLTVIDDPTDEIALAASLRSPVFMFTADELRLVREFCPYESFFAAVSACNSEYVRKTVHKTYRITARTTAQNTISSFELPKHGSRPPLQTLKKCAEFIKFFKLFAELAIELPSHKLLWQMYEYTHLPEIISCHKNGDEMNANLMRLYRLAVTYESSCYRGLSVFMTYLKNSGDSIQAEREIRDDCVRIMTFHKSKGLEFPFVFVCGTGSKFNDDDLKKPYIVQPNGLVAFNLTSPNGLRTYRPFIKLGANDAERKEMRREELRCLYVALTRAREALHVIGCTNVNSSKLEEIEKKSFFEAKSNLDLIMSALSVQKDRVCLYHDTMGDALPIPCEAAIKPEEAEAEGSAVDWSDYAYMSACTLPTKVAVSELHPGLFEDGEYERSVSRTPTLRVPAFAGKRTPTAAEKGSATHRFMQFCSFEGVEKSGIAAEADRLAAEGYITTAERDCLFTDELSVFFASPLYREMRSSPECRRELRFTLAASSTLIGSDSGEDVMVQGVIDCFFKNNDGSYTVVDYKTDRVFGRDGEKQLLDRHSAQLLCYCRAVEKMTNAKVTEALLYSFSLGRAISADIGKMPLI